MNYNYIYSIIELYLKNENDKKKVNLNIIKTNDKIYFDFDMKKDQNSQSSFFLPIDVINNYLENILKKYKANLLIIDEKYQLDSTKKNSKYIVSFNNGRILSLSNFSILEINNIRNILYNIDLRKEEIRVKLDDKEEIKMNYKPMLLETGFVRGSSIFLLAILFADIFIVSLWFFKNFFLG